MKTKQLLSIGFAALLALVAISCQQEEPSIVFDGATSIQAAATGSTQSVGVTTNYDWSATASDPWIHVSPASGRKGTTSLTITVDANSSGKARKGSVTVTCLTLTKSISVSQEDDTSLTSESLTLVEIPGEGGSATVSLSANHDWLTQVAGSWIIVEPSYGKKGNVSLKISAEANNTGAVREGTVTVTCNNLSLTYKVRQKPNLSQVLLIKHNNYIFRVPLITGDGVVGEVHWGDGTWTDYEPTLSHMYSASDVTVTFKLFGATAFETGIGGISIIDISDF